MNRNEMADNFYIEEHAVLFALLVKAAVEISGEKGRLASYEATKVYGKERGVRMALRAIRDGAPLTPENYMLYGEWADPKGEHVNDLVQKDPEYHLFVVECAWTKAWKKHNLLEYGKLYCPWIDEALEEGFNKDNRITVNTFLSFGAPKCNFQWVGVKFETEEEFAAFQEKRKALYDSVVKDFLYHTGHVLWSLRRTFLLELGAIEGVAIVEKAMADFREIFGEEKADAVAKEAQADFLAI